MITKLRNRAPSSMLDWLDSVGAPRPKDRNLTKDWFPLFAKGGAEGSGNYIVRQQGYLADSFVTNPERGRRRLECSITGESMSGLLETSSLSGLFYPGFRGDPNIGQAFDAKRVPIRGISSSLWRGCYFSALLSRGVWVSNAGAQHSLSIVIARSGGRTPSEFERLLNPTNQSVQVKSGARFGIARLTSACSAAFLAKGGFKSPGVP